MHNFIMRVYGENEQQKFAMNWELLNNSHNNHVKMITCSIPFYYYLCDNNINIQYYNRMEHLNSHTNHVNENGHQFLLSKLPIKLITHNY